MLREYGVGILFQEFIPGDEFDVNLYAQVGGETAAAVCFRKTGLKEGIVGNAVSVVRETNRPALLAF